MCKKIVIRLKKQKREMLKERLEKNKAHEAEDEGERKEEWLKENWDNKRIEINNKRIETNNKRIETKNKRIDR